MTTTKMRRGKRSLAAILAAMLMASVLAVVAGSPAQAANTSNQVLIDADGDGVPESREFAGRDRYDTALKLANNFAGRNKYSSVPTVFVASGESLVDSISVSGLAGALSAPVLLTQSGSLHGGVADYIEDHGVSQVYVLGGPAAISDAVVTAIEGLMDAPAVERIQGPDRYATAAAIAAEIPSAASWCGTTAASAVLINGATDALPFGVAVGTMAYGLKLPVLMTAADELPESTSDYISDNNVEHVQIIGGTDTVSAAVADALSTLGVDTVQRVDGETAAEVSVMLAKDAAECQGAAGASLAVAADRVVLVRGNPDGVAAAPVLATGISGDPSSGLIVPLIVGNTLPAVVRDYLAATPKAVGGNKLNLGIVAVGGTAAVSAAVMDAATEAAASTGELAVQIGANSDTNDDKETNADDPVRPQIANGEFTLYFSDAVTIGDPTAAEGTASRNNNHALVAKLRDVIEVNDVPAVITGAAPGEACDNTKVNVTLGQPLRNGDKISIVSSNHKFGTGTDQRTIAAATARVQAPPVDRLSPVVSILGIQGTGAFYVSVTDPGGLATRGALTADDFEFAPSSRATAGTTTGTKAAITTVTGGAVVAPIGDAPAAKMATAVVEIDRAGVTNVIGEDLLLAGDRLTLKEGVYKDLRRPRGNENSSTGGTVIGLTDQVSPKITSVLLSDPNHSEQNRWFVPDELVGGVGATDGAGNSIMITAKKSGDAAGAAGNSWTFVFDRSSTYNSAKPLDIDVRVDAVGKRVTVRFNNGPLTATLGDLLAALKAEPDFDERFTAGFAVCANTATGSRTQLGLVTTAVGRNRSTAGAGTGRTKIAIEVNFGAYVDIISDNELFEDLLEDVALRTRKTNDDNGTTGIRAAHTGGTVAEDGTVTAGTAGGGLTIVNSVGAGGITTIVGALTTGTPPTKTVRYEVETALASNLPLVGDRVTTKAGHQGAATPIAGPPDYPAITPVSAVATGFVADKSAFAADTDAATVATDEASDTVDEDKNAGSIVPISRGGGRVKPPL